MALPAPVTPPPITRTSKRSLFKIARLCVRTVDDRDSILLSPCSVRLRLFPAHRALDGSFPVSIELIALVHTHFRLECAINRPLLGYFLYTAPEASCQPCQVSCAQGSGLGSFL